MGSSSGSKKVAKYYDQAGSIYDKMSAELSSNPLYLQGKLLAEQYSADPFTYGDPSFRANLLARAYDQGQGAYTDALGGALEKIGQAGGLRSSGFTRGEMNRMAVGLGQGRAEAARGMEIQARESRSADIQNLLAMINNLATLKSQPEYAKAGMLAGAASNPIWAQPSPLQSLIGPVVGAGLGLATGGISSAKGLSNAKDLMSHQASLGLGGGSSPSAFLQSIGQYS